MKMEHVKRLLLSHMIPPNYPLPKTELLKLTIGTAAGTCCGTGVIPPIVL